MSLQVKVKLNLTKIKKSIVVKYNTFEKATFDQYLCASIALRAKSVEEIDNYIDDITGNGSLNVYFKRMCEETQKLSTEQLQAIMESSLYPILKIDSSNRYEFYPELNISVFDGQVYQGDFGTYEDVIERLQISETIIEKNIQENKTVTSPEPYLVSFDNDEISVEIQNTWIKIEQKLFIKLFINEVGDISKKYQPGMIHNGVDGNDWNVFTMSAVNNLFSNKNYFYENGDHYKIRNDCLVKTVVSQIAGFYIYREENIPYQDNQNLCDKSIEVLMAAHTINEIKTRLLLQIIENADVLKAQEVINYILRIKDSKEITQFGIRLLQNGVERGWNEHALQSFIANSNEPSILNLVYQANPKLDYQIEQLLQINPDLLSKLHKKQLDDFKNDREGKIDLINKLIGEVTNSGMREKVKSMRRNDNTQRFKKLSNDLQGHNKVDIKEITDMKELNQWQDNAMEYYALMKKLQVQLREERI